METKMIAAAIIVIIIIAIVAAFAAMYHPASVTATTVPTTVPPSGGSANASIGLTNTGGAPLASGCTASSVFGCTNASITTSGQLSLSLTSMLNTTMYDIHIACIDYTSSTNRPANMSSWYALDNLGTTKPYNFTGTSVQPGGTENIASLQCYAPSGSPASLSAGQAYEGLILVNYTGSSGIVGSGTGWTTAGAAAVNLNAVQTG
jgi:hypothetical protein